MNDRLKNNIYTLVYFFINSIYSTNNGDDNNHFIYKRSTARITGLPNYTVNKDFNRAFKLLIIY